MRRTLMQRNRELLDFEVDPVTGVVRIIDVADDDLVASLGLSGGNGNQVLMRLIRKRAVSPFRGDRDAIIEAFGARSNIDLALMGHGLSLTDLFWYRKPGETVIWDDINFFDNAWNAGFGEAVLAGDYARLAGCSPDVPETTTPGLAPKAWERSIEGIFLTKAALTPDGTELQATRLAFEMCSLIFDGGSYVPMVIVERHGRPCTSSPHMLGTGEELADVARLNAMAGMRTFQGTRRKGIVLREVFDAMHEAYKAIGVADASARVARMACFTCMSICMDSNPNNFGAIRTLGTGAWRATPIFDYGGCFGFMSDGQIPLRLLESKGPLLIEQIVRNRFSFLDPSWDWSWYDPHALDGFEDRILETYATCKALPSAFTKLVAHLFCMQRNYVNGLVANA